MMHTRTIAAVLLASLVFTSSASCAAWYIIGGTDAKEGAAPYQVSIQQQDVHTCGGSIVGDRWILTAAHCAVGIYLNQTKVVVGTNNLKKGGIAYGVDRVFPYKLFYEDDIALLRLAVPLKFNKRIRKIAYSAEVVPDNANLTVTGWGWTINGTFPEKLQTLDLRHVALDRCRTIIDKMQSIANTSTKLCENVMCTFNTKGQGTCMGDSGSPLIWKGKQVAIVIRGTTKGNECALGLPDIHTRISYYYDWIQNTIASNSD